MQRGARRHGTQNRTSSRAIIELVEKAQRHDAVQNICARPTPHAAELRRIAVQKTVHIDTPAYAMMPRDDAHEVTRAVKRGDVIFMR